MMEMDTKARTRTIKWDDPLTALTQGTGSMRRHSHPPRRKDSDRRRPAPGRADGQAARARHDDLHGVQDMTSTVVDGRRLTLRLLQPGDAELLTRFFWRLSGETVYRRFFSPIRLPNDTLLKRLVDVDHCEREALIALDDKGIVGAARYGTGHGEGPDLAVVVADDWQCPGLGGLFVTRPPPTAPIPRPPTFPPPLPTHN